MMTMSPGGMLRACVHLPKALTLSPTATSRALSGPAVWEMLVLGTLAAIKITSVSVPGTKP
jgi:hypothetical protein